MGKDLPAGIRLTGSINSRIPTHEVIRSWEKTLETDALQSSIHVTVPRYIGKRDWMCKVNNDGEFLDVQPVFRFWRDRGYMPFALPTYKMPTPTDDAGSLCIDEGPINWVRTRCDGFCFLYEKADHTYDICYRMEEAKERAMELRIQGTDKGAMYLRYRMNHYAEVGAGKEFLMLQRVPVTEHNQWKG